MLILSSFQDLIDIMLSVDPKRRVTAAEALKHPWISVSYLSFQFPIGYVKKHNISCQNMSLKRQVKKLTTMKIVI